MTSKLFLLFFTITLFTGLTSCKSGKYLPSASYGFLTSKPSFKKYGGVDAFIIYNPTLGINDGNYWGHSDDVSYANNNVNTYIDLINSTKGLYIHRQYAGSSSSRYEKEFKIPFKGDLCGYYFQKEDKIVLISIDDLAKFKITNENEKLFFSQVTSNNQLLRNNIISQYEDKKEQDAYNIAIKNNTVLSCQDFLQKHPNSKYKPNIDAIINKLKPIEAAKKEAEISEAKKEEERKKKLVKERGADYVDKKNCYNKIGMSWGKYEHCNIEFADGTRAVITYVDGYWTLEGGALGSEKLYYQNEDYATKAAYSRAKGWGTPINGRYYPESTSSSTSSSSNENENDSKYESIEHPGMEKISEWHENITPYDGKHYWQDVEFADGIKGVIYRGGDSGDYFIENSGGANYYYVDYKSALRALYVYKKYNKFIDRGKNKHLTNAVSPKSGTKNK